MFSHNLFIFVVVVVLFVCQVQSGGEDYVGRYTWDGEGYNSKPERSLVPHHPSVDSGVTIGRGYDMRYRTKRQIIKELTTAGISEETAKKLSEGAKLSSQNAEDKAKELRNEGVRITLEQEKTLFDQTYAWYFQDTKDITARKHVEQAYGKVDISKVPVGVWEFLTDLHYQGKYDGDSRKSLIPALINSINENDWSQFWQAAKEWNNDDLELSGKTRKDIRDLLISERQKAQPCSFGRYYDLLNGVCEKCAPGTYSRGGQLLSCSKCPEKTYSKEGWGGCSSCPWGTFLFEGKSCKKCPKGTYNAIDGSSKCLPCPPGKTSCEGAVECFPPWVISKIGGCSS